MWARILDMFDLQSVGIYYIGETVGHTCDDVTKIISFIDTLTWTFFVIINLISL